MRTRILRRVPADLADARNQLCTLLARYAVEHRPVVLSSGRRSDVYVDCRRVLLRADAMARAGCLVADAALELGVAAVGGPVLGATLLALPAVTVAYSWGADLDAFAVRSAPKGHGTRRLVERAVPRAADAPYRVAIVEDVVTTGASVLRAIDACKDAGLEVVAVIALVDRGEGGRQAIASRAVAFRALFTLEELLQRRPGGEPT